MIEILTTSSIMVEKVLKLTLIMMITLIVTTIATTSLKTTEKRMNAMIIDVPYGSDDDEKEGNDLLFTQG